jgi:hypothetical protein
VEQYAVLDFQDRDMPYRVSRFASLEFKKESWSFRPPLIEQLRSLSHSRPERRCSRTWQVGVSCVLVEEACNAEFYIWTTGS